MRRSICLYAPGAVICLALAFASQAIAAAEDAVGNWKDTETGAICSIYSCGGGICIKVVRPAKEFEKDTNNPNPSLRDRSMAGVTIMSGASKPAQTAGRASFIMAKTAGPIRATSP
jgi:uncharacterized protein (DUF2147 family)